MHVPQEDAARVRGHRRDRRVLQYLREMIRVCRMARRRDLRFEYEYAWEFAAEIIYGPLPARPDYRTGEMPESVATQFPAGYVGRPAGPWPLRKIVKKFKRRCNTWEVEYETLECAHIVSVPAGYSVPAKSRRCPHCAIAAQLKKKKPAATASIERSKAVSA